MAPPQFRALLPLNVPRLILRVPLSRATAPPHSAWLLINSVFSMVADPLIQTAPPFFWAGPRPLLTNEARLTSIFPRQVMGPFPLKRAPSILASSPTARPSNPG